MNSTDQPEFAKILSSTLGVYGASISPDAASIWFAALSEYPIEAVRAAISDHVKTPGTGRFAPKPADLIERLQSMDGRPNPEESWARLSSAIGDENATVVLTGEERLAFYAADAVSDDPVAARMAFKEVYVQAVREARRLRVPARRIVIQGHDPHAREAALIDAAEKGWLTLQQIAPMLPHRDHPDARITALIDSMTKQKRIEG